MACGEQMLVVTFYFPSKKRSHLSRIWESPRKNNLGSQKKTLASFFGPRITVPSFSMSSRAVISLLAFDHFADCGISAWTQLIAMCKAAEEILAELTRKAGKIHILIYYIYTYPKPTKNPAATRYKHTAISITLQAIKYFPDLDVILPLENREEKNRHLHMGWALTLHGAWNTLDCSLRKVHVFFRVGTSIADRMIYVAFWRHRWHVIQCMCVIADMWFIVWYM